MNNQGGKQKNTKMSFCYNPTLFSLFMQKEYTKPLSGKKVFGIMAGTMITIVALGLVFFTDFL